MALSARAPARAPPSCLRPPPPCFRPRPTAPHRASAYAAPHPTAPRPTSASVPRSPRILSPTGRACIGLSPPTKPMPKVHVVVGLAAKLVGERGHVEVRVALRGLCPTSALPRSASRPSRPEGKAGKLGMEPGGATLSSSVPAKGLQRAPFVGLQSWSSG
jgi:hypothetical protein